MERMRSRRGAARRGCLASAVSSVPPTSGRGGSTFNALPAAGADHCKGTEIARTDRLIVTAPRRIGKRRGNYRRCRAFSEGVARACAPCCRNQKWGSLMLLRFAARVVVILIVLAGALPGAARAANDPTGFIADLGARAINVLTSTSSETERERQFRGLFEEGFDVNEIARFVLGPYWRTATDAQRAEFIKLFENYVVHAYTMRFNAYAGQQLKVLGARPEGDNAWVVQSQIALPNSNQPPARVDWPVTKHGDTYKIADVTVEGVSMALTQRQEFASVIQRNGGPVQAFLQERW